MTGQQGHCTREVVVALLLVLHGAPPEGALLIVAPAKRQHHGQRDLAVAEIVAHRLAQYRFAGAIVEGIVDQLIGDAEVEPEASERFLLCGGALGHHRAKLAGGGEQRCGLRGHHFEIGGLAGLGVVGGG